MRISYTMHTDHTCITFNNFYCRRLRKFCHLGDRAIIYVFIAASYTPWYVLVVTQTFL